MKKYKVEITEVLTGTVEIEAASLEEAVKKLQAGYEDAGNPENKLTPLQTEEMTARIFYNGKEKRVRLI